ncbi:MAG: hypothetical protein KDC45_12725 [Bacteroidetes bacterium]|nr:hypothetical protein [Bacteroidota bacterium]
MNSTNVENSGLSFAPVSAEIRTPGGDRVMAVDSDFLVGLTRPGGAVVPYELGYDWGREMYELLERESLKSFPNINTMRDLAMPDFQKLFSEHLSMLGWGTFELKKRDEFLFVDVHHSPLSDAVSAAPKKDMPSTSCDFYAGFLASIFSAVSGMNLASIEITCSCENYDWCSFLLDNETVVQQVRNLIGTNYQPLEAFQKIKAEMGNE